MILLKASSTIKSNESLRPLNLNDYQTIPFTTWQIIKSTINKIEIKILKQKIVQLGFLLNLNTFLSFSLFLSNSQYIYIFS